MVHMIKSFSIIIAIFAIHGQTSYCPSGKLGRPYVDDKQTCAYPFNTAPEWICCDEDSFWQCNHTGMISGLYYGDFYVLREEPPTPHYTPYMYKIKKGNAEFVCHYPIGYLWRNLFKPKLATDTPPSEYLPTDHFDITTKLKTCQANEDCGVNEFCGDVLNYSKDFKVDGKCKETENVCKTNKDCQEPQNSYCVRSGQLNVDPNQHFCYKRPEITGNNADKSQYAIKPTERNLLLCVDDTDCTNEADTSGYCHKGLAPVEVLWSGFVPNPDPTLMGEWIQQPGLCVEAILLAYIFLHSFNQLSPSDKQGIAGKKYLAVDYEVGKYRDQLKKCTKNAECSDKQFCGNIFSLTHPDKFDNLNTFCFTVPEMAAPHNSNTTYTILPESLNLVFCDTDQDCKTNGTDGNSFCHIETGQEYAGKSGSTTKLYKGLCVDVLKPPKEESKPPKEESKPPKEESYIIIIVVSIVIIVIQVVAALIGGFVFYKLKLKNENQPPTPSEAPKGEDSRGYNFYSNKFYDKMLKA